MGTMEENLRKSEAALKRAEERYALAQTPSNALRLKYARDDVSMHRAVLGMKQH